VPATAPTIGHVLFCHGNGGNIGDRAPHASLLAERGFDVLLFDYHGYGRSPGRANEEATYEDARAGRTALLAQDGVDPARVLYLGESLGAAVALELALAHPPAGLILQSPFTSIRDIARVHYPFIPRALVPEAYPSLDRIPQLRAPLLVIHGARDPVVPFMHGEEMFRAAPEPKRLEVFPAAAHNDLGGDRWADLITDWAHGLTA
jgi:pimeloyl-ACP methyl ester carboxylesterase